ncbi:UNVERIFIED_CONTAM: hypothetical protein GTU68_038777 [Idotea baltica]|nr:hypothetical protein [Idotea baltica]
MIPFDKNIHSEIAFQLEKNGEIVQNSNTNLIVFNFNTIVSFISKYFTLQQGDVIFTGTPKGVGEVKVGDTLRGIMSGKEMFICNIK